jgi:hypothetical protein
MKRGTLSNLKSDFHKRRRRAETWLERALSFPDCAPTELAAMYVGLTGEEIFTKHLIFDADGLRDTATDVCYIYPHPDEPARICYGADARDWPVDDTGLWPWKLSEKKLGKDAWLLVLVQLGSNDLLAVGATSKQMYTYSRLARLRQIVDRYPTFSPLLNRPEVFTEKPYLWRAANFSAHNFFNVAYTFFDYEVTEYLEIAAHIYTDVLLTTNYAAVRGDLELLRFSLDIWDDEDEYFVAAKIAARFGRTAVLQFLVDEKHFDFSKQDRGCETLEIAVEHNQLAVVQLLLETFKVSPRVSELYAFFKKSGPENVETIRYLAVRYIDSFISWCTAQ